MVGGDRKSTRLNSSHELKYLKPACGCKGGGGGLVQSMAVTSALRPGGIPRGQAGDSASRSPSRSAETRLRNVE